METIRKDGKILKVKSRFHQESQLQKFFSETWLSINTTAGCDVYLKQPFDYALV